MNEAKKTQKELGRIKQELQARKIELEQDLVQSLLQRNSLMIRCKIRAIRR